MYCLQIKAPYSTDVYVRNSEIADTGAPLTVTFGKPVGAGGSTTKVGPAAQGWEEGRRHWWQHHKGRAGSDWGKGVQLAQDEGWCCVVSFR